MTNIYVAGSFEDQAGWDDLICRLAFYFAPYLSRIDRIEICASAAQIKAAARRGPLDPAIDAALPGLKDKLVPVTPDRLRDRLGSVDGRRHLFLLADDRMQDDLAREIGRFRPYGRFYRVDPARVRMEGSFYLWAGLNAFCDPAAEARAYHERFRAMAEEIGQYDRAHVFGTGPSLSGYVETTDFEGDLGIIANSIVLNHEMLDKVKPKLIVAADPIFHAGCSSYAAAFRAALEVAMDRTGAWFLCPLRDVKIYAATLPDRLQDRIIGIPFDAKAPPPTNLGETFALKPYPNILTLMLLPMAASFAREVRIAGCDGRPVTENKSFWTHDKKAQFNDEMDNIKAVHPGFFAIDYNNYYFDHARELEQVLATLESAGRVCVNASPSYLPALNARSLPGLRPGRGQMNEAEAAADAAAADPSRRFDPRTVAILDPDAKGDWGHFLAYDRRLGTAVRAAGLDFAIIGREDLPQSARPDHTRTLVNAFTRHSWTIGNKWPQVQPEDLTAFAFEVEAAIRQLEEETPGEDIALFMYCGAPEVIEMLEHILIYHPRVRAVITLFWTFNFDTSNAAFRDHWRALLARAAKGAGQVRVLQATRQAADDYRESWGVDLPVLPHPSTTFGDARAAALAKAPAAPAPRTKRPRVLFPGGARREKGYLLATGACGILSGGDDLDLQLRARLDANTEPELRRAVEALESTGVGLVDGDFPQEDFVDWLGSADVMVIPYLPEAFAARTSGMLVDAMLLGIPVVVIEGTWLADELALTGGGVTVAATPEAVAAGVRAVLADYAAHAAATRVAAERYLAGSTWKVLAGTVLSTVTGALEEKDASGGDISGKEKGGAEALHPVAAETPPLPLASNIPGESASADGGSAPEPGLALFAWSGGSAEPAPLAVQALGDLPKDARALVLFDDPEARLAQVIAAGGDAPGALARWRQEAGALLPGLRRVRRQAVVFDRARHAAAPEACRTRIAGALPGRDLPLEALEAGTGAPGRAPDPLHAALAGLFLAADPEARKIRDELRASSLRPAGMAGGDRADPGAALAALRGREAYAGQAAEARREAEALRGALDSTRAEAEEATARARLQGDQLRQLRATAEAYGREADRLRAELGSRKTRSEELHREIEGLTLALEEMRRSTSWKMTAPIRALRRILPGGGRGGAA